MHFKLHNVRVLLNVTIRFLNLVNWCSNSEATKLVFRISAFTTQMQKITSDSFVSILSNPVNGGFRVRVEYECTRLDTRPGLPEKSSILNSNPTRFTRKIEYTQLEPDPTYAIFDKKLLKNNSSTIFLIF